MLVLIFAREWLPSWHPGGWTAATVHPELALFTARSDQHRLYLSLSLPQNRMKQRLLHLHYDSHYGTAPDKMGVDLKV